MRFYTFMFAFLLAFTCLHPLKASSEEIQVEQINGELSHPWGLAFLPDGRLLVTERAGRLRFVNNGKLSAPLSGLPDIWASGQGGLLDIVLSPDFETNRTLFLSFSEPDGFLNGRTAVMSARLVEDRLEDVRVIFRQSPALSGGRHFGSRIVPMDDGTLMITLGDRGHRDLTQNTDNLIGKIVRINPDGSIPKDNPFIGQKDYAPEIYSIGHRNPQGAAKDKKGRFWTVSHGARGGDEINRPEPGKNYGWPVISYGRHYTGLKIGVGTHKEGMEQPKFYWDPSIAPSGMTFYDGDLFPQWQGDIFVGALVDQALVRVMVEDGEVTGKEERLLVNEIGRIRLVTTGPDGALWLLSDEDPGGIYRLTPKQ